MRALLKRAFIAAALLGGSVGLANAECYIELHGKAAEYGFNRAGPYSTRAECNAVRQRYYISTECTCGSFGPTPEDLEWMRRQEEEARAREAEQRRLEAERERQRQISFYNSQGNDMLYAGRFDEAIRAYQMALSYGQSPAVQDNLTYAWFRQAFARGRALFDGGQWDLAIGAYREALTYRPGDHAAESNIKAAEARKLYEQEQAERRAKRQAAFRNMQRGIEEHVSFAEAERAAALRALWGSIPPKRKLFFGDPDSPTDRALNAKIALLDTKIERDMQAIRNLGIAKFDEDYQAWVDLDESARADAIEELQEILHDVMFDLVKDGTFDFISKLDTARGVKLVYALENCGCALNNPALIDRIKVMSRRGNSARFAEEAKLLTKEFEGLWKADQALQKDKQLLEGISDVADVFVDDARFKILLHSSKMGVAAGYRKAVQKVAREDVERLTKLTERQLKALTFVQRTLIKHVQERRELKRLALAQR